MGQPLSADETRPKRGLGSSKWFVFEGGRERVAEKGSVARVDVRKSGTDRGRVLFRDMLEGGLE